MSFQNIVFLTEDLFSLSRILKAFGFVERGSKDDIPLLLYQQNNLFLTVRPPQNSDEELAVERHGTFIHEIWLSAKTEKRIQIDELGVILRCLPQLSIDTYFSRHFPDLSPDAPFVSGPLNHIDHIAINLEASTSAKVIEMLTNALNLTPLEPKYIRGNTTSFTCHSFQLSGENAFLVLNTSHDSGSQICTFIDRHKGPGVQHLAFHTEDLETNIPVFKNKDIPFVSIPKNYYDTLEKEGLKKGDRQALEKASLLLEKSHHHQGHLKQTFTKDLIGPIFFEFIHRRHINGFGEKNIKALFKAVESDAKNT